MTSVPRPDDKIRPINLLRLCLTTRVVEVSHFLRVSFPICENTVCEMVLLGELKNYQYHVTC